MVSGHDEAHRGLIDRLPWQHSLDETEIALTIGGCYLSVGKRAVELSDGLVTDSEDLPQFFPDVEDALAFAVRWAVDGKKRHGVDIGWLEEMIAKAGVK